MEKIIIKKEKNYLHITLRVIYYIAIFGMIFWGAKGIEYKGIMKSASSTINALIEGFFNPDMTYATNSTID
jgi:ABC-type phosphate/phosphonate transport system permease subunit